APLPRVGADRRRTAARVLVDARGAGRPGGTRRRPVLGRRAGPPRDPAVADGRLGLRPLPPGPGPALAALRAPVAADLGRTPRGHLAPRGGRLRLLQQRPGRRGGRRRGGRRPYGAGGGTGGHPHPATARTRLTGRTGSPGPCAGARSPVPLRSPPRGRPSGPVRCRRPPAARPGPRRGRPPR